MAYRNSCYDTNGTNDLWSSPRSPAINSGEEDTKQSANTKGLVSNLIYEFCESWCNLSEYGFAEFWNFQN